jgi:hypothetical protein
MWDRSGQIIEGAYLDSIYYKGIINTSRVGIGGLVRHDVVLFDSIDVMGASRDSIIVAENELFVQAGQVIEVELEGEAA